MNSSISYERRGLMQSREELVSIIVPVYNVEQYLKDCLDSIFQQSYQNIEVIVVNDGSTDGSREIVIPFLTDQKIKYIEQENKGLSGARNTGLQSATGKYILFVDSDDYIEKNMLMEIVFLMKTYKLDLVRFNADSFSEEYNKNLKESKYDFSHRLEENKLYKKESLDLNRRTFSSSVCLYLTTSELINNNQLVFYENILHEDELFTTQVFLQTKRMMYKNVSYYHRRYRSNSIMTDLSFENRERSFDSYIVLFNELERMLKHNKYTEKQKKFIKRQMISIYSGLKNSRISENKKNKVLKKINSITIMDKLFLFLQKLATQLKAKRIV